MLSRFLKTIMLCGAIVMMGSCRPDGNHRAEQIPILTIDSSLNAVFGMFSRAGTTTGKADVVMTMFILRQHFNLDFPYPTLPDFISKRPYLQDRYFKLYDQYFDGKFYVNFPDDEVWQFINEGLNTHINTLTFWSMYCDKFPLDERFLATIKARLHHPPPYPDPDHEGIPPPDYWPLLAALQLQSALNNGCLTRNEEVTALLDEIERTLVEMMNGKVITKAYDQDIRFEAVVMLYYLGLDHRVPVSMIREIIAAQQLGGGWSYFSESDMISRHTSLLAMWALLEYRESLQRQ